MKTKNKRSMKLLNPYYKKRECYMQPPKYLDRKSWAGTSFSVPQTFPNFQNFPVLHKEETKIFQAE